MSILTSGDGGYCGVLWTQRGRILDVMRTAWRAYFSLNTNAMHTDFRSHPGIRMAAYTPHTSQQACSEPPAAATPSPQLSYITPPHATPFSLSRSLNMPMLAAGPCTAEQSIQV